MDARRGRGEFWLGFGADWRGLLELGGICANYELRTASCESRAVGSADFADGRRFVPLVVRTDCLAGLNSAAAGLGQGIERQEMGMMLPDLLLRCPVSSHDADAGKTIRCLLRWVMKIRAKTLWTKVANARVRVQDRFWSGHAGARFRLLPGVPMSRFAALQGSGCDADVILRIARHREHGGSSGDQRRVQAPSPYYREQ